MTGVKVGRRFTGGRRSHQPATRSWPNELVLTSHFRLFHVAYDGLPTVIDVDVLDANVLLPTVTKPSKHFDLGRIGVVTPLRTCGSAGGSVAKGMKKISYRGYRFPPEMALSRC